MKTHTQAIETTGIIDAANLKARKNMNTPKESLVELARNLPEGATYDDIIYRLHVLSKTERGLRAEAEGRLISVEEARKRTSQWRSK